MWQTHKDILIQARLDERLFGIEVTQIQIQLASKGTQQTDTGRCRRRSKSLKETNTLTLIEPPATSLAFTRTTSPCSFVFHAYTDFAEITLSPRGCYVAPNVPTSASSLYSFPIAWRQMSQYSSVHASAYDFGVESSFTGHMDRGGRWCGGAWWKSM